MYIKRLHMAGFKSFADSTELVFGPGLSAIVGPNGSGKSNISDALRWVLGEASARSLRGLKMEDVIFGGSRHRKPLGMAEVELTLDNNSGELPLDFAEVSLARRIFRGTENFYFLNKSPCRLKDLHELLSGTGLGQGALSILSDREVELVLSSNPADRRSIIEETAGVSKYRFRKKETLRKLEETRTNLLRLGDIKAEVESQLRAAEVQVQQYKRYKRLQERLAAVEILCLQADLRDLLRGKDALLERKKAKIGHFGGMEKEASRLRQELFNLQEDLQKKQCAVEGLRGELSTLEDEMRGKEKEMTLLEERASLVERDLRRLRQRIEDLADTEKQRVCEREKVEQKIDSLVQEVVEQKTGLVRSLKHLESLEDEGSDDDLQEEAREILFVCMEVEKQSGRLGERMREHEARLGSLRDEEANLGKELDDKEDQKKRIEESLQDLCATLEDLQKKMDEIRKREEGIRRRKEGLEDEEKSARDRLLEVGLRKKSLEDIEEVALFRSSGVRALLLRRREFPGIRGTISHLLQVPPEYEEAIVAALGAHMEDLVTDTTQVARRCIEYLRGSGAGRATFWPLDLDRRQISPVRFSACPGIIGRALDLVGFGPEYRPIFVFLLGRVLLFKELGDAVSFYRDRVKSGAYLPKLVTLKGEVLDPSGAIAGGGEKAKGGRFFSLRRQKEGLKKEEVSLKHRTEQLKGKILSLDETLARVKNERMSIETEISHVAQEHQRLSMEQEKMAARVSSAKDMLRRIRDEAAELSRALEDERQEQSTLQETLEDLKSRDARIWERLRSLGEERASRQKMRENLREEVEGLRIGLARSTSLEESLRERASQLREEAQNLKRERETVAGEVVAEEEKKRTLTRLLESLRVEITKAASAAKDKSSELGESQRARDALQESISSLEGEIAQSSQNLEKYREDVHALDLLLAQMEARIQDAEDRISHLGGPGFKMQDDVPDRESLQKLRERLNAALVNLGGVNLGALETFERIKERDRMLLEQIHDITGACEEMRGILKDLDRASCQQFLDTFQQVNREFGEMFSDLFGGGRAYLELSSPDDLLETGVEIIAQPPGKKLQHLSLLSSGEKALASIALLFALLRVKPAPFVIIDELDAPLDDANVEKVASKILEFSRRSQFIVITHNRKTMEYADYLYGVTMEEPGISKIVSVRLEEVCKEEKGKELQPV